MSFFVTPHGGNLVDVSVATDMVEDIKTESKDYKSVTLSQRQSCDLELLMNGAFSPLKGFMGQKDYESVVDNMTLADGSLWPIPIVLDVTPDFAEKLEVGEKIALRDGEGFMPAIMTVQDIWEPDRDHEALQVYGSSSEQHPGVRYLKEQVNKVYIGGPVEGVQAPIHYDFESLWDSPRDLRELFSRMGWRRVVAFQTSRPMHRLEREITLKAAKEIGGHILLHPSVGMSMLGDMQYYARVHCYQAIRRHFPHNLALLSLMPMAERMAGPREALWLGIVHQNYGCSHFIVGPDYASPGNDNGGNVVFYGQYAAQELVQEHQDKLEIEPVLVEAHRYVPRRGRYLPQSVFERDGEQTLGISDEELKDRLSREAEIPDWFSYPDVINELSKVCPPRSRKGLTLFFTGLSGAGKSTLAKIIYAKMIESGGRPVTLLDGDVVRLNLSSELGFSKEHRNLNVRRIGFVAGEITKNGGIAICAPIAPYTAMRRAVREMIEEHGSFIEIHVATPLETCEARDRKGLYAKARQGLIPEFTGISDPYEVPESPELRIDTTGMSPMEAAQEIYLYLLKEGYLDDVDKDVQ